MRHMIQLAGLAAVVALSACQNQPRTDDPANIAYSKSNANRAKTDDPIKALQKY